MDVCVTSRAVNGRLRVIASKSHAHRLLIAAGLASCPVTIGINALSRDIEATIDCLGALGAAVTVGDGEIEVKPAPRPAVFSSPPVLDCGESGSTARFLLPVAAALCPAFILTGSGRLPERPFVSLCREMAKNGCTFDRDRVPIRTDGRLCPGRFELEGNVSSQFISGLLFALPLLEGESRIALTTPLESASYVDLTREVLTDFGVHVQKTPDGFLLGAPQSYTSPGRIEAEGDWSNAAFFLVMGALCGSVSLAGLNGSSVQGDREILFLLERFGARISTGVSQNGETVITVSQGELRGIEIDAAQIPDLVPVLAAAASLAEGTTRIYNAGRLRLKESDRLASTRDTLAALGADIEARSDELIIRGKKRLAGGTVSGQNDHRIVMTAAVAACGCENPVVITGAEAVQKSYPGFFADLEKLGGRVQYA